MGSPYAPIMNDDTSRIYSTVEAGGLLWNADTGAQIAALPSAEDGIWSSDGQRLLTRSAKLIQIWDADVGQKLSGIFLEKFGYNFDGWVMWNADESRILTTHPQEGQIMIWEAPIR
jgi:hypothetical protein